MNNKIVLGTVQFGLNYGINNETGQIKEQEINKILRLAEDSGITSLDSAAAYGDSEIRIGNFLTSNTDSKLKVITKFKLDSDITLMNSLDASLNRLGIDHVDTIMFHNYHDFLKTGQEELKNLLKFKGTKFNKIGISLYTNDEIDRVLASNIFEVVQIPFNVLDNWFLRGDRIKKLKAKGIEVHTRSAFLQGLFFMEYSRFPKQLLPLVKYLKKIDDISTKHHCDKASVIVQYVHSKEEIDALLIGVDSSEQLINNLSLLENEVPKAVFDEIDKLNIKEIDLLNPSNWI